MTSSNHVFQQETFHITSDSEATLVVHITQELTEALKAFCEKKAGVSNFILTRIVLLLGGVIELYVNIRHRSETPS